LSAGEAVEVSHLDQILEFLKVFADRCHHGKEEGILFPALEEAGIPNQGGPIGVMLHEHTDGRVYIKEMDKALDGMKKGDLDASHSFANASRRYIELLKQHIEKENHVLFPMADESLAPERQENIAERFDNFEKEEIGAGRHEAFHKMMDELAEIYLGAHTETH
jgi:hemerythrin-like domain-containing protein